MRNFLKWCWTRFREERWYLLAFGPSWVLLTAFYVWTVYDCGGNVTDGNYGHYGELARAFKLHQLALPVPVDPVLVRASNPYDPNQINGHFIWDLSYYKGHYYLFYGATPCVLLFYPWLMLTGRDMNQCLAYVILCSANLFLFGLILRAFSRYSFPGCPVGWLAALFFVFGLANPATFLLRLTDMYEIACAAGSAAILFSIYFLFFALHASRGRWLYLALVSFGWGAAVGARPNFAFGAIFLLLAWLHLAWEQVGPRAVSRRRFLGETAALAAPGAVILALIGWYNDARFDSPFDFGLGRVTAGVDNFCIPHFSTRYLPDRLWEYLLMPFRVYVHVFPHPLRLEGRFPFIDPSPRLWPALYTDRIGWEHMTGIFPSFPILLVGLAWAWAIRRLPDPQQRRLLGVYGLCLSAAIVGPFVVLLFIFSLTYRYLCDFVPTLYVLVALTLMARRQLAPFARWQTVLLVFFLVFSAYAGFAYTFIGDTNWIWSYYQNKYGGPMPWENYSWDF